MYGIGGFGTQRPGKQTDSGDSRHQERKYSVI